MVIYGYTHDCVQVTKYEETLSQLQSDLEKIQEQYRRAHAEVRHPHLPVKRIRSNVDPQTIISQVELPT